MLSAAQDLFSVGMPALLIGILKGQNGTHDPQGGIIDAPFAHQPVLYRLHQLIPEKLGTAHFHILSAVSGFHGILYAPDEIAHDKAVEIPFLLQHLTQQIVGMAAVGSLVQVIGAHDTRRPRIHTILKMGQIHLSLGTPFTVHAHLKSADFHGIKCKMLDAGHDILRLYASHQGRTHLSQRKAVLPVDLLAASPAGVIGQIDAHSRKQVAAVPPYLTPDGMPDFFLQLRVKAGAAAHRYRKAGAFPGPADHPSWPVAKKHRRNAFPFISPRRIRSGIIMGCLTHGIRHHILECQVPAHQVYLFLQRHPIHNLLCLLCKFKSVFLCLVHLILPSMFRITMH